jgi:hypothetical protein
LVYSEAPPSAAVSVVLKDARSVVASSAMSEALLDRVPENATVGVT